MAHAGEQAKQDASAGADRNALRAGHPLDSTIEEIRRNFAALQKEDGHWLFELEADVTIPAEYIMLLHYLDETDPGLEAEIAQHIRSIQQDNGGWPLFYGGEPNLSGTVKGYFALKLVGDQPDEPHMERARELILSMGGAARANVFTRITLALFGQLPWRGVPTMPVEIMLLPRWFPFHLDKVSYWSRTVIVPLLILMALRPKARNPKNVNIRELFTVPPGEERHYFRKPHGLGRFFLLFDKVLKAAEPLFPAALHRKAINRALEWITLRLNGEDGLGGIFPAMANSLMVLDCLGYGRDNPTFRTAKHSIDRLLTKEGKTRYCQPCLPPIWDTCLGAHAMLEAGEPGQGPVVRKALDWLVELEIHDVKGDWSSRRPGLEPAGWPFQYRNPYYPDVDDTAVVGMAMHRADSARYAESIRRTATWIEGMQSANGGWGAFDVDNVHYYLNHIPFADHGALLDPPEVDVTARCLGFLAQIGYPRDHPAMQRGIDFILENQEDDGSWYGRWGTNYIYGTWSALCAFNAIGDDPTVSHVRRAVEWLKSKQLGDGGWGERGESYYAERRATSYQTSTASQTAWALLGLMAAGQVESDAVRKGVEYLTQAPRNGAKWLEDDYTAVGFPRVFYLRYDGYSAYFPLWALARYRNLIAGHTERPSWGM